MKTLARFLAYIIVIECFYFVLAGPHQLSGPYPNSTTAGVVAYYFGVYLVRWGFWMAIYESVYQFIQWRRRRRLKRENQPTKELEAPDTQPLSDLTKRP